jgi:hypothetical protein
MLKGCSTDASRMLPGCFRRQAGSRSDAASLLRRNRCGATNVFSHRFAYSLILPPPPGRPQRRPWPQKSRHLLLIHANSTTLFAISLPRLIRNFRGRNGWNFLHFVFGCASSGVAGSVPVVIVAAGRPNQREPEHGESVRTLSPTPFCPPTLPPQNRRGKSREDRVCRCSACVGRGFRQKGVRGNRRRFLRLRRGRPRGTWCGAVQRRR